jgi:signal transduction histidine kinase
MPARPRDGLTIRAALLLAFGLVLGLWFFSGLFLTRRMNDVQREADAINARYVHTQELLSTIRTQILLASVFVRDALLDPAPGAAIGYRLRFDETFAVIDDSVRRYEPVVDSAVERQRVERLHGELAEFRRAMLEVLAGDRSQGIAEARLLLSGRIVPRRDGVIRVSQELQALNRGAFIEHQDATAAVHRTLQRRVWRQLGLALAASFAIGLVAVRHVTRLEDRLRSQREREVQYTRDLQRLSTRLVTAQEEERRTIARELHDEVGQVLTALKVELALAERGVDAASAPFRQIGLARQIADGALRTVRDLSRLLHPSVLDDLGLPAALESLVRDASSRHNLAGEILQDRSIPRLTPPLEVAIYRIAQEAVTNVVRHSQARTLRVALRHAGDVVTLIVEDDGKGFVPTTPGGGATDGLGLVSIRERAAQLRGTLHVESTPAIGTRLSVTLPLELRAPDELPPLPIPAAEN